jgi:acyl carrier protein
MDLLDAVLAAAANYLEVDPGSIGPATTFAYLQVDSLDVVNILEDASAATGLFIELDPDQDFRPKADTTLAEFVAHLTARPD